MLRSIFLLAFAYTALAQSNPAAMAARQWRQTHERQIMTEFVDLLAIPNIASDQDNIRRNARAISALFEKRGVRTRLLEVPAAPPVIYGQIQTPGATRTVIFYAHYDGQPLDPKEWATPPWQPVLRDRPLDKDGRVVTMPGTGSIDPEWRIYARSASDDKAPIVAIAAALDAIKASSIALHQNINFVFEGEEEAGSPHLSDFIRKYQDLLRSDLWLICDGPVHQSRRQQIVFGARGIVEIDLTVYGPIRELHSGHYGNWVPNAAMKLAHLLSGMKADDGRVLIEHFYDGIEPLSNTEKAAIAQAPPVEVELMNEFRFARPDGGGKPLIELLNYPSLNIRGMSSARTGQGASNVIPASATASIDIRLVKGITPQMAAARLAEHLRARHYFIVDHDPDAQIRMSHPDVVKMIVEPGGYNASRTSMDLPISQLVLRTADSVRGPVVRLPTMGGSVPLFMIDDILHTPAITIPIANHDNNQHSSNENLRVRNLWDGIELMTALMAM